MVVLGLVTVPLMAKEEGGEKKEKKAKKEKVAKEKKPREKKAKPAPEKPEEVIITLEGKLIKTEKKNEKSGKTTVTYSFEKDDGTKIRLPAEKKAPRKKGEPKPEAAPSKLEPFANKKVQIRAMGFVKEGKGKPRYTLTKILGIEKAGEEKKEE